MILDKIRETKIIEVGQLYEAGNLSDWKQKALDTPSKRGFLEALQRANHSPSLIAEIKKGSPSAGVIRENFDPVEIAKEYELAGADCLSVLTDFEYFSGSNENLQLVRNAVQIPLLRKDFIIDPVQVFESAILGADAILIIVRWLDETLIKVIFELANELDMDSLFETHNESEISMAVRCGAKMIGVNNRDLDDFSTRLELSESLLQLVPNGIHKISESALKSRLDIEKVTQWGADSVLIGTAFCEKPSVFDAVNEMMPWSKV